MVKIYKKRNIWVAESEKLSKIGNRPVWKKITTKRGLVKKGHGFIVSRSASKRKLLKKMRGKGYDV